LGVVKKYVASTGGRLELFFLLPYSPELNPNEWVKLIMIMVKLTVPMWVLP